MWKLKFLLSLEVLTALLETDSDFNSHFQWEDNVCHEFVLGAATVNKENVQWGLVWWKEEFYLQCPEMLSTKSWVHLHDIALAHQSLLVQQQLTIH
jgi:hypothetical protein